MNYSKEQNKEFAIKLLLLNLDKGINKILAVNRGDLTNKELKEVIKKYEK